MTSSDREPPDGPSHNIRLLIAYDGTDFRGLAPNRGVRTVVGELVPVLEPLIGGQPDIVMSGRTDAGVHAWGQVLSFTVDAEGWAELGRRGGLRRIQRSVNSRLGPEVVVREIAEAPAGFSARLSATGRRYRYMMVNREVPDPFLARTAWWVAQPLDVEAMQAACPHLVGEHDFSSFCRRPRLPFQPEGSARAESGPAPGSGPVEVSLVRRVTGARWLDMSSHLGEGVLRFDIEGSAFCHQMVRSIVGFLVAVGSGKRRAEELPDVLAARDRSRAENPAPSHGLTLWQVDYDSFGRTEPQVSPRATARARHSYPAQSATPSPSCETSGSADDRAPGAADGNDPGGVGADELPPGAELVRTTPIFTESSVPAGLLAAHRVASGVWGRLAVSSGAILFRFEDEEDAGLITAPGSVVIPPDRPHHLEIVGPVRFVVEFHRVPDRS